jgi:hypothetical protein
MADLLLLVGYLLGWVAVPVAAAVTIAGIVRRWISKDLVRLLMLFLVPTIVVATYWLMRRAMAASPPSPDEGLVLTVVYLLPIGIGVLLLDNLSGLNPPTRRDIVISAVTAAALAPIVAPIIWVFGCAQNWTECP